MKSKWIKRLAILFTFAFLFIGTGCSSNPYDGQFCGNAKDPNTEFGKIRYTYIIDYLADEHEIQDQFIMQNGDLVKVDENGQYLFVLYANYYGKDTDEIQTIDYQNAVGRYFASNYQVTFNGLEADPIYTGTDETAVSSATEALADTQSIAADFIHRIDTPSTDKSGGQNNPLTVYYRLQSHSKACFVVGDDIQDPDTGVTLTHKTWGDAFKVSFFTGLIVYPMAWLLNTFVNWFGGTGVAQVFAILLVTLIIKVLVMLVTFKGTMSTHRMQEIQPEIAKIQAKYGNNKSPEVRQRMGMEMMNVYKKYNIKPFAPFLSLIITFPIFIGMYRAVITTAALRTGSFLGIVLGTTISSNIFGTFRVGALIIFLFMAASQILSMKMPNLLNRKRMTYEAKKAQKQTSMMTNIFMIMILVMGFMMPATMSIYWIASALVQVLQNVIMHHINNAAKGKGRYKLKKVEKTYTIPKGTSTEK